MESKRAVGIRNRETGETVWFPNSLIRARKTYIALPIWLYEQKRRQLLEAGFTVEERKAGKTTIHRPKTPVSVQKPKPVVVLIQGEWEARDEEGSYAGRVRGWRLDRRISQKAWERIRPYMLRYRHIHTYNWNYYTEDKDVGKVIKALQEAGYEVKILKEGEGVSRPPKPDELK